MPAATGQFPDAPVRVVVAPGAGDDRTARIQKAIDYVAGLPADSNGVRGAVLLLKGRHEVSGGLQITNSGVVLRGQGMGEDGNGARRGRERSPHADSLHREKRPDVFRPTIAWQITDDYVPVGREEFSSQRRRWP
jgi:hypothetical protein